MDPDLYPDGSGSVVNTLPVQKIIDKLEDTGVCVKNISFLHQTRASVLFYFNQ